MSFFNNGIEDNIFVDMDVNLLVELIYGNIVSLIMYLNKNEISNVENHLKKAIAFSWKAIGI